MSARARHDLRLALVGQLGIEHEHDLVLIQFPGPPLFPRSKRLRSSRARLGRRPAEQEAPASIATRVGLPRVPSAWKSDGCETDDCSSRRGGRRGTRDGALRRRRARVEHRAPGAGGAADAGAGGRSARPARGRVARKLAEAREGAADEQDFEAAGMGAETIVDEEVDDLRRVHEEGQGRGRGDAPRRRARGGLGHSGQRAQGRDRPAGSSRLRLPRPRRAAAALDVGPQVVRAGLGRAARRGHDLPRRLRGSRTALRDRVRG